MQSADMSFIAAGNRFDKRNGVCGGSERSAANRIFLKPAGAWTAAVFILVDLL
jgi:hypothetical protein